MQDLAPRNVPAVSSLPSATTALAGVVLRLTTDNKPYWCNGTEWVDLTAVGGGAAITVSDTAPVSPAEGDIWIDTSVTVAEYWMKQSTNRTLTSSTALQKLFNVTANGALTIPTGVYRFESFLYLTGMSSTSGNALFNLLGAGTATLDKIGFHVSGADNNTPTATATRTGSAAITSSTPAAMVTAGTGTGLVAEIQGTFEVTATGTLIPSIQLFTAAAATLNEASYIHIKRIGNTGDTYSGPWS